ncbi:MAG: ABC transporter ATP-binding protein [Spirochaetes bacterium]|nr:MAG: ABC transporter ATP-binding protein [Spirochaetota bacterium]
MMNNKPEKLLEANDIVMKFGGLKALNRVTLHVNEDEVLGLIGPNGSGKTTFFNVTTGIYRLTEGDILFANRSIVGKKPQEIAHMGIIRTFQTSRLWFDLSVLDNLLLGMYMRPKGSFFSRLFQFEKNRKEIKNHAIEALEILSVFNKELADNPYRIARELALVDRRRIEICRALLAKPKLLLLDEPSAGMDPSETSELMEDIKKLRAKKEKLGIIIIEHDMTVISSIADRVAVLNFGEKIAQGSFEEIRKNKLVREAYLGRE